MNGTDIYDIMKQLGHSQRAQTEEYIKDIVEAKERQSKLKGIGICLDAAWTQNLGTKNIATRYSAPLLRRVKRHYSTAKKSERILFPTF